VTAAPPRLLARHDRREKLRQGGVLGAGLLCARLTNPDRPLPFDICLWKRVTGFPCPTCGLTRAVCYALRGEWSASVHLHPAGLVVAAALVAWLACTIADAVRGEVVLERARPRLTSGFLAVTAVVSLVFWVTELTI
jgi:hypothetical protein